MVEEVVVGNTHAQITPVLAWGHLAEEMVDQHSHLYLLQQPLRQILAVAVAVGWELSGKPQQEVLVAQDFVV